MLYLGAHKGCDGCRVDQQAQTQLCAREDSTLERRKCPSLEGLEGEVQVEVEVEVVVKMRAHDVFFKVQAERRSI